MKKIVTVLLLLMFSISFVEVGIFGQVNLHLFDLFLTGLWCNQLKRQRSNIPMIMATIIHLVIQIKNVA